MPRCAKILYRRRLCGRTYDNANTRGESRTARWLYGMKRACELGHIVGNSSRIRTFPAGPCPNPAALARLIPAPRSARPRPTLDNREAMAEWTTSCRNGSLLCLVNCSVGIGLAEVAHSTPLPVFHRVAYNGLAYRAAHCMVVPRRCSGERGGEVFPCSLPPACDMLPPARDDGAV